MLFAVSECLEYPDFSGIVLYRFVVTFVLLTNSNYWFTWHLKHFNILQWKC